MQADVALRRQPHASERSARPAVVVRLIGGVGSSSPRPWMPDRIGPPRVWPDAPPGFRYEAKRALQTVPAPGGTPPVPRPRSEAQQGTLMRSRRRRPRGPRPPQSGLPPDAGPAIGAGPPQMQGPSRRRRRRPRGGNRPLSNAAPQPYANSTAPAVQQRPQGPPRRRRTGSRPTR